MPKNGNITTVQYDVKNLIFAEYNPRELTQDQHQDLKDSITRFGFVDPLIVNTHKERKNILVGGHQRLKIAKELGYKDVPCVEVDLTPDKEKELNVRLNKNTGQWDWDALANYFDVGELLKWGFSEDELQFTEPDVQGLTEEDDIPEVEESITKQGDLWILGEHRVLCGDATIKADVDALMGGEKADMVFTDPPYNVDYEGGGKNNLGKIKNDSMSNVQFENFLDMVFSNYSAVLKGLSPIYVCHGDSKTKPKVAFELSFDKHFNKSSTLIWSKQSAGMGWQDYRVQHEPILYGWKEGKGTHPFYGDRTKTTIWDIKRDAQATYVHPTQKPVQLISEALFNSSKNSDIAIDLFLGSGSTLIACEKTNRKCFGMEIDPHYCDVIVKRWEDYTGNKAERFEAANA